MCIRDRYEKLDSNMEINPSGTGLGLPICKKLTELMGGTIQIKSIIDKGTSVKFSIENKRTANAIEHSIMESSILNTEDTLPESTGRLTIRTSITHSATHPYKKYWEIKESMKALVVDDDYTCAFAVQSYFKLRSMICDMALSGKEAIRKVREQLAEGKKYVVILVDLNMPDINGIELARKILRSRKLNAKEEEGLKDVVIVGLTGYLNEETEEACKRAGMREVMLKPCRRAAIAQLLLNYNIDFLTSAFSSGQCLLFKFYSRLCCAVRL
eukprot:TRINITY_DN4018_c0_g1_i7.p1 TRINITY_DN4018_c0_g1~~TRINITY_DN4018_c0_g1_i7.p1  ORF type:complete len:270 (-),score=69.22 TRINITY_DN4018_c0_g1_i7:741-1550(-)